MARTPSIFPEGDSKLRQWRSLCNAVVGSGTYMIRGYPEEQVTTLRDVLRLTADDGVEWRPIYEDLYNRWHTRRPHFPTPAEMAIQIERDVSR